MAALSALGFELNEKLAADLPDYGYNRLPYIRIATWPWELEALQKQRALIDPVAHPPSASGFLSGEDVRRHFPWLDTGNVLGATVVTDAASCAQAPPQRMAAALLSAARALGARVVRGAAEDILTAGLGPGRRVTGVAVRTAPGGESPVTVLSADAVAIAMGPWSPRAASWLGAPPLPTSTVRWHGVRLRAALPPPAGARCFAVAPLPYASADQLTPYITPWALAGADGRDFWVGGAGGDEWPMGDIGEPGGGGGGGGGGEIPIDEATCDALLEAAGDCPPDSLSY
jgi:hypothetical protein